MQAFAYSNSPYPIRDDLIAAHQFAWRKIANAGTWWAGAERVAIASEVRAAADCDFCMRRKSALSPFAPLEGDHHHVSQLPANVIDVVHRLTTDPARLTETWLNENTDDVFSKGHYVEIISVVVAVLCIDSLHQALGFELEPLPQAQAGEPSCHVPENLETDTAWVPMISSPVGEDADLWQGNMANVIRAMSLVPDGVRLLKELSAAQYLVMADVANPAADGGRAISRAQIELIAGRVSAINDCFY